MVVVVAYSGAGGHWWSVTGDTADTVPYLIRLVATGPGLGCRFAGVSQHDWMTVDDDDALARCCY